MDCCVDPLFVRNRGSCVAPAASGGSRNGNWSAVFSPGFWLEQRVPGAQRMLDDQRLGLLSTCPGVYVRVSSAADLVVTHPAAGVDLADDRPACCRKPR